MEQSAMRPGFAIWLRRLGPLLVAALAGVAACLAEPLFQTNDDAALAMVGAGFGLAVRPEPILVFSHPGYGLLLNVLSRVVGPTAHGWVTMVAVTASLAVVLSFTLNDRRRAQGVMLAIGCAGCVYATALLSPQFTITSILLFAGAVLLTLQANSGLVRRSLAGVMLTLSFLIRPESFLLGICVGIPPLVALSWSSERSSGARFLMAAMLIVVATGLITGWLATAASPEWGAFVRYNTLRAQFTDFNRVPWVPGSEAFQTAHWSQNDYAIFESWFSLDPIFDAGNLSNIIKAVGRPVSGSWFDSLLAWFGFLDSAPSVILTFVCQAGAWWLLPPRRRKAGLLLLLGECAACAALAWTGRSPLLRVWTALADTGLLLTIGLQAGADDTSRSTAARVFRPRLLVAASIAVLGMWVAASEIRDHRDIRAAAIAYRTWINAQAAEFKHPTVVWGADLTWEWLITPTRVYPPFPALTVAGIGALSRSPVQDRVRAQLAMTPFSHVVCTDPTIRLVSGSATIDELARFCEEHAHVRSRFVIVSSYGQESIYKLEQTE